ncbi:MAG TPA: hypothetical protein VF520_06625 [Thermoleophilaceae bacterium]
MEAIDARRALLRAAIGSLCVTAAIAIAALLAGDLDETSGRVLATTALISGYSFLALPAAILADRREMRGLAVAIAVLSILAFLLWMHELWILDLFEDDEDEWKAIFVATAFAAACAQTGAVVARSRPGDPPSVANLGRAGIALGFAIAALASVAALSEIEDDGLYRLVGVLSVLNVLALALRPLVRRAATDAPAAAPPRAAPPPPGAAHAGGVHRFACTLDRAVGHEAARGLPGALSEDGRTLAVELPAETFAAAVGAAIARIEDGSGARVVRIERGG